MTIQTEIKEAVAEIQEQIQDLKDKIETIESINLIQPITEKEWHLICDTPLRYASTTLTKILTNSFPDATEIQMGANYVYFTLYEIQIAIPTSREQGICINTKWYKKLNPPHWEIHNTLFQKKQLKQKEIDKTIKEANDIFSKKLNKYYEEKKIIDTKLSILFNKILPEINSFSTEYKIYPNSFATKTIQEIKELENIE